MNILKRTLAMMLALCMLFGMVPFTAFASENTDLTGETTEFVADVTEGESNQTGEKARFDGKHGKDKHSKDEHPEDQKPVPTEAPVVETTTATEPVVETTVATEPVVDTTVTTEPVVETTVATEATEEPTEPTEETTAPTEDPYGLMTLELEESEPVAQSADVNYRILHLDCGRKYFSKDWIIALINEMAAAGYNQLQLAFGNDGLRFLLDDMSVTVNGTTYDSSYVTAGVQAGNQAYNATVSYSTSVNELTQTEMDAIIAHANSKGIAIVPHMNMPGHMDAILDAIEYVGISDAHFTGYSTSVRSLNLNNDSAVAFTKALLQKYVNYFASKGCSFFHIGADEFANDAYGESMGFSNMGSALYAKFETFVNDCAVIVEGKSMTPRAWNDGISYTDYTSSFDTDIQITYWSSGWSGYNVASASTLRTNGHDMINTHGDYYFVLETSGIKNPSSTALNFDNTVFMGSTVNDPVGAMFCIWCDAPGTATEQEVAAAVRITLRKMAAAMQGSTSYSEEVVSGGFNADGSIAETREWVTIPPTVDGGVQVSGYDLTSIEVTEVSADEMPAVDGAANVVAWDITPYAGETKYTEKGIVNLPVPEGWNTSLLTGFYVENGAAVLVKGTYADGYYSFEMPHFSVGGLAELEYDHLIELTVGTSTTKLIENVDLTGNTYTPDPAGIATVTTAAHNVQGTSELVQVNVLSGIVSGGKYVFVNKRSGHVLGDTTGNASTWGTTCLVQKNETATVNSTAWTITVSGSTYYLQTSGGSYMTISSNASNLTATQTALTMYDYGDGTFGIAQNGYYLNDMGNEGEFAGGYDVQNDAGAPWYVYRVVTTETVNGTDVTFTGTSVGETYVTINNEVYKVVVSYNEKELNIVRNGSKTETQSAAITGDPVYSVSGIVTAAVSGNTVTFTAGNTLGTTVVTVGDTRYTINVIELDLAAVEPLTLEYWITNGRIQDSTTGLDYVNISAAQTGIYSVNGVAVTSLVPATGAKDSRTQTYWQSKLLDVTKTNTSASGTEEQTVLAGDDETLVGSTFTHVRYWNGEWQVLVGTTWTDVNRTEVTVNTYDNQNLTGTTTRETHQLVIYYMEVVTITNDNGSAELLINSADWGTKGDNSSSWGYYPEATRCSVSIQLVYESGDTNPDGVTAEALDSKTIVYYLGENGRGLGTMLFTGAGDYQIFKITAETGDMESKNATPTTGGYGIQVTNLTWDNNEEVVWQNLANPQDSVAISNPGQNPSYEAPYDNLTWHFTEYNENNAILIRVYVKAKVTEAEDTLYVHYIDRTANNLEFYTSEIPGYESTVFNEGIALNTDTEEENDLINNTVQTSYGQTYTVNADLKTMTQVAEYYRYCDYTCVEVKRNADGKDVYLYYTFTPVVSFVVDFGTPITITPNQLVQYADNKYNENVSYSNVTDVGVIGTYDTQMGETANAEYGMVAVSGTNVIYTPTEVLQGVDFFTIYVEADGGSRAYRVYIVPATTVSYEEGFLENWSGTWTSKGGKCTTNQTTQVLGYSTDNYGYDGIYATTTGASNNTSATTKTIGAKATFTFTGTGFELYANGDTESGYVSVMNKGGQVQKIYAIDTHTGGVGAATSGQSGKFYGLPVVSVKDLTHGTYTVTVLKTHDENEIQVDGFRVINTLSNSDVFVNDHEDNPEFYQLRDYVLKAMNVGDSEQYGIIAEMASQVYAGISTDTEAPSAAILANGTYNSAVQDLLNNGPKNEVYLWNNQTLVFNVKTDRMMQIGLKAPQGATSYSISYSYVNDEEKTKTTDVAANKALSSSVDMFYALGNAAGTERTYTVTITNNGNQILSITDLKICDDPNAAFVALAEKDIQTALLAMGYENDGSIDNGGTQTPVVPDAPEEPEVPEEPVVVYADAALTVSLVDYRGKVLGTVKLTANGVEGETHSFHAAEILAAAKGQLPAKYAFVDESEITNAEVIYGEEATASVRIGKVATLKITFINLFGRKQGTATITKVQTSVGYCRISADDIRAVAPAGRRAVWMIPTVVPYGNTMSIAVPVI